MRKFKTGDVVVGVGFVLALTRNRMEGTVQGYTFTASVDCVTNEYNPPAWLVSVEWADGMQSVVNEFNLKLKPGRHIDRKGEWHDCVWQPSTTKEEI